MPKNAAANLTEMLSQIGQVRLEDEQICVSRLKEQFVQTSYNHNEAAGIATAYIEKFRSNTGNIGLEEFFRQYGLDTKEGLAVMSLAEALLRIPDSDTANEFIHETLESAQWNANGKSTSSLVKASSMGLKLAKTFLELGNVTSLVMNPVVRESIKQSLKLVGDHFVMGQTVEKAIAHAHEYELNGFAISYDMLGEGARSEKQAKEYFANYLYGVEKVAASSDKTRGLYKRPGISVKLSALYSKYKLTNKSAVFEQLFPRLLEIAVKAKAYGIMVTIDAEESSRLDISLELFAKLIADPNFKGWDGLGLAVQAYNKAAHAVIDYIIELAKINSARIPIRLVKGAYWDSEIKAAQIAGIANYPVYTQKEYSDISYLVCAHKMLENTDLIYPQFATHNALTIAAIEVMADGRREFEFQRLYGMGRGIYDQVIAQSPCRIYAPVGAHKELLPYLIRRILENGASTSFLKKVIDNEVPVSELVKNPSETPSTLNDRLPLPSNLYGSTRKNSIGFDFGNNSQLEILTGKIGEFKNHQWQAAPLINGKESKGTVRETFAPHNKAIKVGQVVESSATDIKNAIDNVSGGFFAWSQTSATFRAKIIEKFADLLEANQYEAIALCVMEAGKTIPDSVAEIREAIDFCRYYAASAREIFSEQKTLTGPTGELNELSLHSRGVFLCISPWNFPLAIFTGQVVAALVSGNGVIAKPAEQTPLIATFAVKLLFKAGLPKDALSLLPGDGAHIGKLLLADHRTAGVAFTGSCETALRIQQSLTLRGGAIVPFIAETGGLNAMIVDSSALLEQALDDILTSAFGSSGQRCSALRVLYVQDDIADHLIAMLKDAMANLNLGNPADLTTDIGPVIDSDAHALLKNYISTNRVKSKLLAGGKIEDRNLKDGHFIAPTAFAIGSIKDLPGEIFGPVLHIARFKASNFKQIIDDINSCNFGLTLGVHSRIHSRINYVRTHARVGNIYVNRSMIGATVGVQPFGGEGLSGTGPKAGGPHYLLRFVTERCFTENTAAIGGNRELLTTS